MEAAEIDLTFASPPTMASGAHAQVRQAVAVHQHLVRRQPQPLDGALHREHRGCRMLRVSISSTEASAMQKASALSRISSNVRSRFSGVSTLESA
jgi:hypothetical protein